MPDFISNTIQVHVATFDNIMKEYKFLLLQRSFNEEIYPSIWQVITGTIEPPETALQCAIREINEEISLEPLAFWTLPYITTYFSPKSDLIHASPVFAVLVDFREYVKISKEHQAYEWLSFDCCINRLVLPSHREGTRIFNEFILQCDDKSLFQINLEDING